MVETKPRVGELSPKESVVAVASETWSHSGDLIGALADEAGFVGIRIPANSGTLIHHIERFRPSILLLHEELLDDVLSGLDPAGSSAVAAMRILVLSSAGDRHVKQLIERGCAGVLPTDASLALALAAVKAVARGEIWASRRILADVLRAYQDANHGSKLTKREDEILNLVIQGRKNTEIAEELFISRETVRWHLRRLYAKLGIHGRPVRGDNSVVGPPAEH